LGWFTASASNTEVIGSALSREQPYFITAHLNAPTWVRGLLANGIISGVGTVLTFIPILMLFFAAWAFMEDVGYTARAAFVTDKFMHSLGLHGKSVLPWF